MKKVRNSHVINLVLSNYNLLVVDNHIGCFHVRHKDMIRADTESDSGVDTLNIYF